MSHTWNTIIEPFKIKSVEPLGFTTSSERKEILKRASYNLFNIPADKVLIDLLTDSGTGAMSSEQWAGIMRGDESYAGARSFFRFESAIKEITGYENVIPAHQGRAAERILFEVIAAPGKYTIANSHFDTTKANSEASGFIALDLPVQDAFDFNKIAKFKGDMDTAALENTIKEKGKENIALVIITVTNNSLGGQPVSMKNIKAVSSICKKNNIPFFIDCARFAENSYFIKMREEGYSQKTPKEIAKEMFSYADGCMMSAKKDALVNIGGFLALNNSEWTKRCKEVEILGEGFPTYGGLAGRDLEAIAIGLQESLDEEYLKYRITSTAYLGDGLLKNKIPIIQPPGGHAVYVDAKEFLSHIPQKEFPGQALACALYEEAGIRTVEIGSLMFGEGVKVELLRLAIPRRTYTQSHIDFVIEVFAHLSKNKGNIKGLKIIESSKYLRHFTAKLQPV